MAARKESSPQHAAAEAAPIAAVASPQDKPVVAVGPAVGTGPVVGLEHNEEKDADAATEAAAAETAPPAPEQYSNNDVSSATATSPADRGNGADTSSPAAVAAPQQQQESSQSKQQQSSSPNNNNNKQQQQQQATIISSNNNNIPVTPPAAPVTASPTTTGSPKQLRPQQQHNKLVTISAAVPHSVQNPAMRSHSSIKKDFTANTSKKIIPFVYDPNKVTLKFLFANKDGLSVQLQFTPQDTVGEVKGTLLSLWPDGAYCILYIICFLNAVRKITPPK
jgi:hypothetical protein